MNRIHTSLLVATALALTSTSRAQTTATMLSQMWSRGQAEGSGPVKLKTFPLRVEDISHINPMGMMASGHVTPNDHLYLVAKESPDKGRLYDVLAVADGRIVVIQWRPNPPGGQAQFDPTVFDRAVDLKVTLEHATTCWSYVDHLVALDAEIQKQVGRELQPGQPTQVRIPVKAGQVIGKVRGGFTFDFALIDTSATRKGFIVPEQFLKRDQWKPHVVDPFADPQALPKEIARREKLLGKMDAACAQLEARAQARAAAEQAEYERKVAARAAREGSAKGLEPKPPRTPPSPTKRSTSATPTRASCAKASARFTPKATTPRPWWMPTAASSSSASA